MALESFSGTWDEQVAAHLLRRTLFGATYQQIQYAKQKGLSAILDELFVFPAQTLPVTISDK